MKAGIHIGHREIFEGNITQNHIKGSVAAVARQIEQLARPGELLVSGPVRDLVVGSGVRFCPRGAPVLSQNGEQLPLLSVELGLCRSGLPERAQFSKGTAA